MHTTTEVQIEFDKGTVPFAFLKLVQIKNSSQISVNVDTFAAKLTHRLAQLAHVYRNERGVDFKTKAAILLAEFLGTLSKEPLSSFNTISTSFRSLALEMA